MTEIRTISLHEDFAIEVFKIANYVNLDAQSRELIRSWRNAEVNRRWMYSDHNISPEEHGVFLERLRRDSKNYFWQIIFADHKIGSVYLNRCDFRNGNAYWGFYLNPDSAGKGLGWIPEYLGPYIAFDLAGLRTLKLEVIADNLPVLNLHKKAGFQEEGRLRCFVEKEGVAKDVVVMGMLRDDWRYMHSIVLARAIKVASILQPLVA